MCTVIIGVACAITAWFLWCKAVDCALRCGERARARALDAAKI